MTAVRRYSDEGKTCAKCKVTQPLTAFTVTSKGHPPTRTVDLVATKTHENVEPRGATASILPDTRSRSD